MELPRIGTVRIIFYKSRVIFRVLGTRNFLRGTSATSRDRLFPLIPLVR
jgi:hypothetical protein